LIGEDATRTAGDSSQGREALALALEIQTTMAAHAKRAGLEDFFHPGA